MYLNINNILHRRLAQFFVSSPCFGAYRLYEPHLIKRLLWVGNKSLDGYGISYRIVFCACFRPFSDLIFF